MKAFQLGMRAKVGFYMCAHPHTGPGNHYPCHWIQMMCLAFSFDSSCHSLSRPYYIIQVPVYWNTHTLFFFSEKCALIWTEIMLHRLYTAGPYCLSVLTIPVPKTIFHIWTCIGTLDL